MRYTILIIIFFLITGCVNIENEENIDNTIDGDFIAYNSILTYNCTSYDLDTITIKKLFLNDSSSYWGYYIIPSINHNFINARIGYLNEYLIENRVPGYYGRNSKHLTFYLFDNSNILFSNDFIQYDTISLSNVTMLIQQYYLEDEKQLKYRVSNNKKGIDIMVYKEININSMQSFINTLSYSYINLIDIYCESKFEKEYKKLTPNETIELLKDIRLSTEITISSYNSLYQY